MITTNDETADFLLRQLAIARRIGSPRQRADAPKWEMIIRSNAAPAEDESMVASFATAKTEEECNAR